MNKKQSLKQNNPSIKRVVITIALLLFIFYAFKSCVVKDKDEISMDNTVISKDVSKLDGKTLLDAKNLSEKKGYEFDYIKEVDNSDMTDIVKDYDENMLKSYEITKASAASENSAKIVYTNEEDKQQMKLKESLKKTLDPAHAWQSVESYGKGEYPYGFKLHYVAGKLAETPMDESTWTLKAACTVTNESNAKQDMTCEATVTGTTDNPQVIDFLIY